MTTRKNQKKKGGPAVALAPVRVIKIRIKIKIKKKRKKVRKLKSRVLAAPLQAVVLDLVVKINQNLKIKNQIKEKKLHLVELRKDGLQKTKRKIKDLEVPALHLAPPLAQMV